MKNYKIFLYMLSIFSLAYPNFCLQKLLTLETKLVDLIGIVHEQRMQRQLNAQKNPHSSFPYQEKIKEIALQWNLKMPTIYFYKDSHDADLIAFQMSACIFINEASYPFKQVIANQEYKNHFQNIESQFTSAHELAHFKNQDYQNAIRIQLRALTCGIILSSFLSKISARVRLFLPSLFVLSSLFYYKKTIGLKAEHNADLDALSTFSCAHCIYELSRQCNDQSKGYFSKGEMKEYAQKLEYESHYIPCNYHKKYPHSIS